MKCGTTILVTTCNNIVRIHIKLSLVSPKVFFWVLSSLHSVHACMHAIHKLLHVATTEQYEGTLNLRRWVILFFDQGYLDIICWSFPNWLGEFFGGWIPAEYRWEKKEGEQGWNQRIQNMPASLRKERVYVRWLLISASYLEHQHCDCNTHKHPSSQ